MTVLLNYRRFAHDAREDPALPLAQRPALDDGDAVAHFRGVLLVVGHEPRRMALAFAVHLVAHLPLDGNDAALLHLVADDHPDFFGFFCHRYDPCLCFSVITVLMRARSRRVKRSFTGASSCPSDCCTRIRNSWSSSSRARVSRSSTVRSRSSP